MMNILTSLLLVLSITTTSTYGSSKCPRACDCHSSWLRGVTSVVVDCSKKKLTSVPTRRTDRYMTSFVLNENFITSLGANVFKRYRYLRELYLYKNFITAIHPHAFRGLRRLRELSLHSNQIKRIEKDTFKDLRSLKKLYLFTNFIEVIDVGTFNGLKKAETVLLHENLLRRIPKDSFKDLEKLRIMTLYRNYLGTLHTGSLNGLKSLTQLYLHENKMSRIQKGTFQGTPELRTLQLGNNYLDVLSNDSFVGLKNLLELYLDNNRIRRLDPRMFDSLPQVRKLVVLGNRIDNIEPGTFANLRGLTLLSLSHNNITYLRPGMFTGLMELNRLFLQNNAIEWIEPYTFRGLLKLQSLYLFRNKLFYIQKNTFFGLFGLGELNLGVNNISGLANGAFVGLPRLSSLQLNSNRLRMITAGAFSKLRNLYRLVLYFNRIHFIDAHAFHDLKRLGDLSWYPPLALVRSSKILRKIQSNNLHCDCNVVAVKNFLKRNKISSILLCTSPAYLNRTSVSQLRDHYLRCEEPSIHITPANAVVELHSDVTLTCVTNIAANFSWIRDGKPLHSSYEDFVMTSGKLLLRRITKERSGEYLCIVNAVTGVSAASTVVKIGSKPNITTTDDKVIFIKTYEQQVVIDCQATGFPTPNITWFKDGNKVVTNYTSIFIAVNQSLVISKASSEDKGKYKCVARNQLGVAKRTVDVRYTQASSPCQPVCGVGSSCVMTFLCLAPNQTTKQCSEVKYTTTRVDFPNTTAMTNTSDDVSDGSGGGSGDDMTSDDEDGDVGDNDIPDETTSEKPVVLKITTTVSPNIKKALPVTAPATIKPTNKTSVVNTTTENPTTTASATIRPTDRTSVVNTTTKAPSTKGVKHVEPIKIVIPSK